MSLYLCLCVFSVGFIVVGSLNCSVNAQFPLCVVSLFVVLRTAQKVRLADGAGWETVEVKAPTPYAHRAGASRVSF